MNITEQSMGINDGKGESVTDSPVSPSPKAAPTAGGVTAPGVPNNPARAAMPAPTLTALNEAIAKWERMASDDFDDAANASEIECPLCVLFNPRGKRNDTDCIGCPVFAATATRYCEGTPYENWSDHAVECDEEMMQSVAKEEVEFLKSLLPVQP